MGATGVVYAFEPLGTARRYCMANAVLNDLHNVTVLPYGLWDGKVDLPIYNPVNFIGGAFVVPDGTPYDEANVEHIQCVALDSLIADGEVVLPGWRLMKIDIEGAELHALRGMQSAIAQHRPHILVELNTSTLAIHGSTGRALLELLDELGYSVAALPAPSIAAEFHNFRRVDVGPASEPYAIDDREAFLELVTALDAKAAPAQPVDLLAIPRD